ncbi:sulfotransferase [Psychroserpens burtonensis]|uniref:Sulfotransferase n=1 Tax=Psychroserpens burtonensis TaxID=49278 RepID=A0A5C7B7K5_9FLAO|nr:sulfotransferase [Psychroserpens burtonensis]TXE17116.1 sulfotransferase [Psychroserpens burtonensis]
MNNWIAPRTDLLPDFIIGGAMKSGTSTIHNILEKHPKVFIPKKEIGFFDMDNILEHSDFNFFEENKWISQSMDQDPKAMWDWYHEKYKGKESFVKGEDSTTYLASKIAAKRISLQKKDIKLIFVLRQPSLRAYSNYYHLLRTGRATHSFEDTLRFNPFTVINRSLYKEQIESFYKFIPKSRIKIIVFEDLISNQEAVIKDVCKFLHLNFEELPVDVFNIHTNKASVPRSITRQFQKNALLRSLANAKYANDLPFKSLAEVKQRPFIVKVINKVHGKINPKLAIKPPEIHPETKTFLDAYFYNQLLGLDELIEQEVLSKWFNR